MVKLEFLYYMPSRKVVPFKSTDTDNFAFYFPAFNTNYKLPAYEQDDECIRERCTKNFSAHKTLSHRMIMMNCQHQICYGFHILRQKESTIGILNLLLIHFKILPRIIIYDNACNLLKTCMIRDPKAFEKTSFLIDRFHSRNHKCSPFYSMNHISEKKLNRINTQVCEQLFSNIRRISTQISYMRLENVFYTTRYFLAMINQIHQ